MNSLPNQWSSFFGLSSLMLLGLFMSCMSNKVFLVWLGLELKMFSMMPLLMKRSEGSNNVMFMSKKEMNVTFYYFFVQVMGSMFMAMGGMLGEWYVMSVMGLIMKMGLPPFFWWVPPVMSRLDWLSMGLLSTLQKVPGVMLLRLMFDMTLDMGMLLMLVGMTCSCMGMNSSYNNMKKLMGWSSVKNMSVLLLLMVVKKSLGWLYYFVYSLLVMCFCAMIYSPFMNNNMKVSSFLLLIFSGAPPLLGFIMKVYFMGGMYLLDYKMLALKMWIPLPPHYLDGWKMLLMITLLMVAQVMGYIKAFIYLKAGGKSRMEVTWKKSYNWIAELGICMVCLLMVWY